MKRLNVVLMTSRSGSSMVCGILAGHGLSWQYGGNDPQQSARGGAAGYRTFEHPGWKATLKRTTTDGHWPMGYLAPVTDETRKIMKAYWDKTLSVDFIKSGVEFAGQWLALADDAKLDVNFIMVRRPVEQIGESLERRGIGNKAHGMEVARRRFKLMDMIVGTDVFTDLLVSPDPLTVRRSGIYTAVLSCGVKCSHKVINDVLERSKFHT